MPKSAKKPPEEIEIERKIAEVSCHPSVTHVSVAWTNGDSELTEVLRSLEAARMKVSLVKIHSGHLTFVVDGKVDPQRLQRIVKRPAKVIPDCSAVLLRSAAMRMMHGIMADAVKALYSKNIEVHSTSDAYDALALVIDSKHTRTAMTTLSKQFEVNKT